MTHDPKAAIYYGDQLLVPEGDASDEGKFELIKGAKYYYDLPQGSDEWFKQRLGIMTASEMKLVLTPTLKVASNDKERQHLYALIAQRVTQYVEPSFVSDDMLRGYDVEIEVRRLYAEHYAPVHQCGFITSDKLGFVIGYSPDGLVGDDGAIECKSRRAKYQIETIIKDEVPKEYMMQLQTGLLVTGRKWIDFISYSGGLPMFVKRVYPESKYQDAITDAARGFEMRLLKGMADFDAKTKDMIPTERIEEVEIST